MADASNKIRMSGMNSGLDTESIVNALTANTKLKINKQNRKSITLKWKQEAYQDVIGKLTDFQNKYFDTLKSSTNLASKTLFKQYSATVSTRTAEGTLVAGSPAGVTVKSNPNANEGTYDVTVVSTATQATYKGTAIDTSAINLNNYSDPTATYSFNITVEDRTAVISFTGGDKASVASQINNQLTSAFGEANQTGSTHRGLVYIDETTGKLYSADRSLMSVSGISQMGSNASLNLGALAQGSNKLHFTIGNTTKSVSFETFDEAYFNNDEGTLGGMAKANYNSLYQSEKAKEEYESGAMSDADLLALAKDKQWDEFVDKKYDAYVKEEQRTYNETRLQDYNDYVAANTVSDETKAQWKEDYIAANIDSSKFVQDSYNAYLETHAGATMADYKADSESGYTNAADLARQSLEGSYSDELGWAAATGYGDFAAPKTRAQFETDFIADNGDKTANTEFTDKFTTFENKFNAAGEEGQNARINAYADYAYTERTVTTAELVDYANDHELKLALQKAGVSISATGELTADNGESIAVTADASSTNYFGLDIASSSASQITTATTLRELGITGDATFTVNGVEFTFNDNYTIKQMMTEINASKAAGAKMSFSTLTNSFSISSTAYGKNATIDFSAEANSTGSELLSTLGLVGGTRVDGKNLELIVNDEYIETSSNSYTVDGTTMTFTSAAAGAQFNYEVKKDNTVAKEAIKSFVEDYNKLIKEVYEYLDKKPNKDYYALTDDDIEDMDLSDKQQEKWETKAKEGLLYNDSAVSSVMQKLRSVLYSTVETADGQTFSLFSMGITTGDWHSHGQLVIDEAKFDEALELYSDQIAELFAGTKIDDDGNTVKTGIMFKLNDALDGAVKATGARKDKGTLVQLAGLKTGTAATDNSIFDQLKTISSLIQNLQNKYDREQDRYWKIYANLESSIGSLNSQTSYIQQLMQF